MLVVLVHHVLDLELHFLHCRLRARLSLYQRIERCRPVSLPFRILCVNRRTESSEAEPIPRDQLVQSQRIASGRLAGHVRAAASVQVGRCARAEGGYWCVVRLSSVRPPRARHRLRRRRRRAGRRRRPRSERRTPLEQRHLLQPTVRANSAAPPLYPSLHPMKRPCAPVGRRYTTWRAVGAARCGRLTSGAASSPPGSGVPRVRSGVLRVKGTGDYANSGPRLSLLAL